MSERADVTTIIPFANALNKLGIEYYISGSTASSIHGHARSTADIDIVANVHIKHVADLVNLLESEYYIDSNMIRNAINQQQSFNIIHLQTMFKIDVFLLKNRTFDQSAWQRKQLGRPFEGHAGEYPISSPEDTILSKLEWFREGGEISQRQLLDVIGVMKVQYKKLDLKYMWKWASELNVSELLEQAWEEANKLMDEQI